MLRLSMALCAGALIAGCGIEDPEYVETDVESSESGLCDLNDDGDHTDPGECDWDPIPAPDECKKVSFEDLFYEPDCPLEPLDKTIGPIDPARPTLPNQRERGLELEPGRAP